MAKYFWAVVLLLAVVIAPALIDIAVTWFCATFDYIQIGLGICALALFAFIKFVNWVFRGDVKNG